MARTERVRHTEKQTRAKQLRLTPGSITPRGCMLLFASFIREMLDLYPGSLDKHLKFAWWLHFRPHLIPNPSERKGQHRIISSVRSQLASSRNKRCGCILTGLAWNTNMGISVVCMKGEGCSGKLLAKQRWIWCKPAVQDAHGLYRTWPYTVF